MATKNEQQMERRSMSAYEVAQVERLTRMEMALQNVVTKVNELVTRHEFQPVKIITYGIAGAVLLAVLGALISKVVISGG